MFGGKWMDTFMDKLAQKLTAQEMIKANASADAEELNRLRNQVEEYNECLAQMRTVNEEMHAVTGQMSRLLDDTIVPRLEQLMESYLAKLDNVKAESERAEKAAVNSIVPRLEQMEESLWAKIDSTGSETGKLQQLMEESIVRIKGMQEGKDALEALQKSLSEMFDQSGEHVHKENVKVYRNVQAVIVEETSKQSDILNGAVKALTGRLNIVFGLSVAALIAALGGFIFQILTYFRVF